NPGATPPNFATYFHGFDDMVGAQQVPSRANRIITLGNAVTALNTEYGTNLSRGDVINASVLAVNDDHVPAFRQDLEARIVSSPGNYINFFDATMGERPLTIGTGTYVNWQALQNARANNNITQVQFDDAIVELSRRASSRVVGSGFTTPEL